MDSSLEFIDVSKRYRLGSFQGSLREAIPGLLRRWTGREAAPGPELWALQHVSFRAGPGEALAIVGPNGAGKTTTLKLATAVTQPTSGKISIRGRTSALIELGAGFHPDLTGRENIFLNGAILGLGRSEIRQRFDAIVAFSELEAFLDTPVKRYSSGMYARLGFSVAAHVNPEILFVDEVLAVGDLAFQAKCLARMAEMKRTGTTVVIVSHQLPRVRRLCDRGLFLFRGQVLVDGPIDEAITFYQDNPMYASNLQQEDLLSGEATPGHDAGVLSSLSADSPLAISAVALLGTDAQPVSTCQTGDRLIVRIGYAVLRPVEAPVFEVWIHAADGTEYAAFTTKWDSFLCDGSSGSGHVDLVLDPLCLLSGRYLLSAAITASDGVSRYDWHWQRYVLDVQAGRYLQGLVYMPHTWAAAREESPSSAPVPTFASSGRSLE